MSTCYYSNFSGVPLDTQPRCALGYYCPFITEKNPNSIPVFCIPSPKCQFLRLQGLSCTDGYRGAQGLFEPTICTSGSYCPTPNEIYPCPAKHYCPTGTFQPRECDFFSICPQGTIRQLSLNGIIACLLLDLLLIGLIIRQRSIEKKRTFIDSFKTTTREKQKVNLKLADTFKKSMNGKLFQMHFKFQNLGYDLPDGRRLLQNVSGKIEGGKMTAIMGPSGAGKSTFMNLLCGKLSKSFGNLWINGKEVPLGKFKKIYGFVPQDDIMYRELTVRENILHSARIRSPSSWTNEEIEAHVDAVLDTLNLTDVAHQIIGDENERGVSGGQRKRVNIGMEIASTPLCLCLDEPTLDSTAALEVTEMLGSIAKIGMTIIAVIHQPRPEIFRRFDNVMMIVPGGRVAYFGPTNRAREYFEGIGFVFSTDSNEADVLMDILCGRGVHSGKGFTAEELAVHWSSESKNTKTELEKDYPKFKNPEIAQPDDKPSQEDFNSSETVVTENSVDEAFHDNSTALVNERGQFRSLSTIALEIFVGAGAGSLMGGSVNSISEMYAGMFIAPYTLLSTSPFYWPVPQFGLLTGLAVALSAAPSGVRIFSEERPIYWRYTSSGHSPIAYYIGKNLASLYRMIYSSLHFASVLYFFAKPMIPFWVQFSMILLMYFGVYGLSIFVSTIVKRENATLLAVVVALFCAVFCGYGPTITEAKSWGLYFLWAIQFNMWGCEAQFSETLKVYEHVYENQFAIDGFGYTLNRTIFDFVMMVAIGIVWRIMGYVTLVGLNRDKQR
ncbi:hypothetical protein HDV06_003204 [Boothiomyces sp. JEL0866]|nr:hypothetical protein HDV06_003204 [Boothiomyces sp. JEL0866]